MQSQLKVEKIDAHGMKIQGEGPHLFAIFWEGGCIGVLKNFWGHYTFLGFIAFLFLSLAKIRSPRPVCIYG
jgi:hypothetical protein